MSITGRTRLQGLHRQVREAADWCLEVAAYYDVPVTVTSGYRSWQQQAKLRQDYEEGRSRWPANRPGDSAHNYGLAWDSVVPAWAQSWWSDVRRLAGFEVLPNDVIHAQVPGWRHYIGG